jgi:hypothetical protein
MQRPLQRGASYQGFGEKSAPVKLPHFSHVRKTVETTKHRFRLPYMRINQTRAKTNRWRSRL